MKLDFSFLVKRAAAIIVKPRREWTVIKGEHTSIEELFAGYAVIVAAVPAVAGFLGYHIFGKPTLSGYVPVSLKENLRWTILSYILSLGSAFLLGYIIDLLAPYFGGKKNLPVSMKIVVYAHTASWVAGVLLIVPHFSLFAVLVSLYSLFLLYTGLKMLKEVPPERMVGYFAAAIFASIILSMVILLIAGLFLSSAA